MSLSGCCESPFFLLDGHKAIMLYYEREKGSPLFTTLASVSTTDALVPPWVSRLCFPGHPFCLLNAVFCSLVVHRKPFSLLDGHKAIMLYYEREQGFLSRFSPPLHQCQQRMQWHLLRCPGREYSGHPFVQFADISLTVTIHLRQP